MQSLLATVVWLLTLAAPFPPAKMAEVTEKTKCDWGPVTSVANNGSEFVVATPAGPVTYKAAKTVQVFSKDGKSVGPVSSLKPGQSVRVYYVIDNGAKVVEVDLQ
jgi:hypothetical protein